MHFITVTLICFVNLVSSFNNYDKNLVIVTHLEGRITKRSNIVLKFKVHFFCLMVIDFPNTVLSMVKFRATI